MAFEGLSSKLQNITNKLRGKARITESDLKEMLREVKLALLEADVNYTIVKEFIATVQEKALGQDVLKSLTPGQQVIKIVKDELIELLGGTESKINFTPNPPTVIMLVGLQGSGKTTTAGKLANLLRKQGKKPLLVACDIYRPAAIKQLQVVGAQLNIPVFANEQSKDVVHIAKQAMSTAMSKLNDVVILDTAGRLHIDEELMQELKNVKANVKPHEILLVVDSMTGQDAVNVAKSFNENLGIDGVVLTKLDGDTRGGAALSVKKVTGRPIKFAATGEKLSDIEVFHPDRMAQRILGMGDVLSIIEKAEESFDLEEAEKIEKQLKKKEFDLDDYLTQLRQIKKMGSFSSLLKMIPGMNQLKDVKIDDKESVCKVIEYNENVNTPVVIAGRQIENDNECLLDNAIVRTGTGAEKYIGKKIVLENNDKDSDDNDIFTKKEFEIVGIVDSPMYISSERGNTSIGNGTVNFYIYTKDNVINLDYYTEMYVTVAGAKEQVTNSDGYLELVNPVIDKIEGIKQEREDARYNSLVDEANEKINDAQKELNDKKAEVQKKLNDAEKKIKNAENQIASSENSIKNGEAELAKKKQETEKTFKEAEEKLEQAEEALLQKEKELNSQKEQMEFLPQEVQEQIKKRISRNRNS